MSVDHPSAADATGAAVTVAIRAFAHGGAPVGDITACAEHPALIGKRIFVPFSAPGDVLEAEVTADHPRYCEGALRVVGTPGPGRVIPPCPLFTQCGGCDYQHLDIETQREQKRRMVAEMLERHGQVKPLHGVEIGGGELPSYGYRSRVDLHLSRDGRVGFYRPGTGDVVDCEVCLLMSPPLQEVLTVLRTITRDIALSIGSMRLEEDGANVHLVAKIREELALSPATLDRLTALLESCASSLTITQGGEALVTRASDAALHHGAPGHFSQVNRAGNEVLRSLVLSHLHGDSVTELYAGAGNFSFPLVAAGKSVIAVESAPALVVSAEQRVLRERTRNLTFITSSCERYVRTHPLRPTVLLDPPRGGARGIVTALTAPEVREIVYVSCNLPTLTRDIRALSEAGFTVERCFLVDMFAQTHHVETVTILRRGI